MTTLLPEDIAIDDVNVIDQDVILSWNDGVERQTW
jgi:hypothetical protein